MAHLMGAEALDITVGSRPLFRSLTLGLDDGARIGVVGRNGAGKSTLLDALAGRREPDGGRVTRAGGVRVALVSQKDQLDLTLTVQEAVHGDLATHEWAGDAAVRDVHRGLLPDLSLDATIGELSGGQRRRVALAAALTDEFDVLILDEPTNHLDVEGVTWLAAHLNARFASGTGALLVVSHDRWFLDEVVNRIWEVVPGRADDSTPGRVEAYDGGYAAYVLARVERERVAAVDAAKRHNILRKELAWLRRGAPARTSKPKFRLDAAAEIIADEPPPRDTVTLTKMATARLGKQVIDLKDATFTYPGADAPTFENLTWGLAPGERVGILGVNGAGKSTLLGLLDGHLVPQSGRVRRGKTVALARLDQHTRDLDEVADLRVVEAVAAVRERVEVGGKELTASQLVERLGFTRERAWTPVSELSGGERRRLQLMRILVSEPNVLLLDEPTNDLDTDTLANVEDLLDGWPGTLVVVSHDRYLVERVCDSVHALFGDGKLTHLPGGIDEYLRLSAQQDADDAARAAAGSAGNRNTAAEAAAGSAGAGTSGAGGSAASAGGPTGAERRAAQKELSAVERRMGKLQSSIEKVHARMAEHDQSDFEGLAALTQEQQGHETELAELEERWLELSDALE